MPFINVFVNADLHQHLKDAARRAGLPMYAIVPELLQAAVAQTSAISAEAISLATSFAERADHDESTGVRERAIKMDSTVVRERAVVAESTRPRERAAGSESTVSIDRAELADSSV